MTVVRGKILAISGSTRESSANGSILKIMTSRYSNELDIHIYDGISELPHFNPDLDTENNIPLSVKKLRELIAEAEGVIICTPEYIFSLPGAMKNVLEWTVSTTVFSDKPVALIVASASGEKAYESLTLIMNTLGAKVGEHSKLLIQGARGKIKDPHQPLDAGLLSEFDKLIHSFTNSIGKIVS